MTDKSTALQKKYAPMTKAQLKGVAASYAVKFPEWTALSEGAGFSRELGPIRQVIWFQKMSSAAYRPTHVINTNVLPMPRMLSQILDVKHREVEYRWHERKFLETLSAMEQQFQPDIRKPLNLVEVLRLCEAEARSDAANDLTMLAILYAWLNRNSEALDCCERIQRSPLPTLAPVPEWETAMKAFARGLASAVSSGNGSDFLANAATAG